MKQTEIRQELLRLASQLDEDRESGVLVHGKYKFGQKVYLKNQTHPAAGVVIAWVVNERADVDYHIAFEGENYGTYSLTELTDDPKETEAAAMNAFYNNMVDDDDED